MDSEIIMDNDIMDSDIMYSDLPSPYPTFTPRFPWCFTQPFHPVFTQHFGLDFLVP